MTVYPNLTTQTQEAQFEVLKEGNIVNEVLQGMDKQLELRYDISRYFMNRI